jgi:hypothetical protein
MPNASPDSQGNILNMSKVMENDLYQQAESADEYLNPLTLGKRIHSLVLSTFLNNTNSNNNDNKNFKKKADIRSTEGINMTSGSSTEGINITSGISSISTGGSDITIGSRDISIHSSNTSNRITKRKKTDYDDDDDDDHRNHNTGTMLKKLNQVDGQGKKKPKGQRKVDVEAGQNSKGFLSGREYQRLRSNSLAGGALMLVPGERISWKDRGESKYKIIIRLPQNIIINYLLS